jgi:hypothetical protein
MKRLLLASYTNDELLTYAEMHADTALERELKQRFAETLDELAYVTERNIDLERENENHVLDRDDRERSGRGDESPRCRRCPDEGPADLEAPPARSD